MRITRPIALATGLIMLAGVSAGAQTPPPPTEQQPPSPAPSAEQIPPATSPPPAQPTPDTAAKKPRFFVSANVGYQIINQDFETASEFEAFEETATLSSSGELKSGPIFDAGIAYQLSNDFGIGAAFSFYTDEGDVAVVARVPHPLFFDQIRVANYQATGVKHSSAALHLNAVWFVPFTTKIDFQVSAGPSIVFVKQDVVTGANLLSENPPFTEPRIDTITLTEQKKTAFGFNAAADMTYSFTPTIGVGFTARYLFASADLDGLVDSVNVGGFQALGGIRFRF
jgi:hypothetical protein